MTSIKNFYDLNAWKKAHQLSLEIYKITSSFPKSEIYGITSQLRRVSSSVSANIAEGFARYHFKDKVRFYHNARGSAVEVQNFLLLSKDLEYIGINICKKLMEDANEVGKLINGLIRAIKNQSK